MDNIRILLVEDCQEVAEKLRYELEYVGYSVDTVETGESAIEYVSTSIPDLILMDVMLAGEINGFDATNRIKKNHDIPIIILTGNMNESLINDAVSSNADAYLAKSSSFKEINIPIMMAIKQHRIKKVRDEIINKKIKKSVEVAETNMRMILALQAFDKIREEERKLFEGDNVKNFYNVVVNELMRLTEAQYGALALFDRSGKVEDFITVGMSNIQKNDIGRLPEGHGMLKMVYENPDVVRLDKISKDQSYSGLPEKHPVIRSLLGSAIITNNVRRAAIYLANKKYNDDTYTDSDELVLRLFIPEIQHTLERNELVTMLNHDRVILRKQRDDQQRLNRKIGKMRDQLVQSEKMASIGQLAAGVAHEINNPIGYVSSNFSTLKKYISDIFNILDIYEKQGDVDSCGNGADKQLTEIKAKIDFNYVRQDIIDLLNESNEGIDRVRKIVQDLKDFSHVDEAEWQWANINNGINSTLNIVNNELKYKAEVIKELGDVPEVECIASQLNQVFMNLLVNAAHAIMERGTINIKTGRLNEGWVFVEISDDGAGIKQEHIKNIFDPFFTTKSVGKGTGLGLSLSYSIIQKHHGKIDVRSKEGVGTKFTIYLPISQTNKEQEAVYKDGTN